MRIRNVELRIEKLVLHGFAPGDRHLIGEAVEGELVRLLTERDPPPLLAQSGEIALLDGGAFEMKLGSRKETLGAQIAQAVYGGLRR